MKKAGVLHRVMAFLFDWAIVYAVSALILARTIVIIFKTFGTPNNFNIMNLFVNTILSGGTVLIFICFYFVYIPYLFKGQSLGKKFFGIKIVKSDGSDVDLGTLFLREIVCKVLVDFLCIGTSLIASGFVLVLSDNHLTFHDTISSTMVVDAE